MKLGIIVDSSSGLNKNESDKKGWGFIPLHLFIDGKDYRDGIDLESKNLFNVLRIDSSVKTAATSPSEALKVFEKMSKEFDHVIVYSLSSKLSSQNNNLKLLSNNFDNIHVVGSLGVSEAIKQNCFTIEKMSKNNNSIEKILQWTKENANNTFTIIVPKTLEWLVKGGRVNSSIASMSKMFKIVPQLKIENGEISKFGKGRTFDKTIFKSAQSVIKKTNAKTIYIQYSRNQNTKNYKKIIEKELGVKVITGLLPAAISLHVGIDAIGIMGFKS